MKEELEEKKTDRPFVWHDEKHYIRIWKRGGALLAAAVLCGLIPYILLFGKYIDGIYFSTGITVVVFLVLLVIFRKSLVYNLATYVSYGGELYRISDANRSITRIALDNDGDYPDFEQDFRRAAKAKSCWRILKVDKLSQEKNRYVVSCRVAQGKKEKKADKKFYIEPGYQDMESLMDALKGLES